MQPRSYVIRGDVFKSTYPFGDIDVLEGGKQRFVLTDAELMELAPGGYHIALRIGFAFPLVEMNAWPPAWVDHYIAQRLILRDPVIRWVYAHEGSIRWRDLDGPDPARVLAQARDFGLAYGVAVACRDKGAGGLRSFGAFARSDRDFTDAEMAQLESHVRALHGTNTPPQNLTKAELEALCMVSRGLRQKEVAFELGVSEGAIKQRLRNARTKLDAATAAQAARKARDFGLI